MIVVIKENKIINNKIVDNEIVQTSPQSPLSVSVWSSSIILSLLTLTTSLSLPHITICQPQRVPPPWWMRLRTPSPSPLVQRVGEGGPMCLWWPRGWTGGGYYHLCVTICQVEKIKESEYIWKTQKNWLMLNVWCCSWKIGRVQIISCQQNFGTK